MNYLLGMPQLGTAETARVVCLAERETVVCRVRVDTTVVAGLPRPRAVLTRYNGVTVRD